MVAQTVSKQSKKVSRAEMIASLVKSVNSQRVSFGDFIEGGKRKSGDIYRGESSLVDNQYGVDPANRVYFHQFQDGMDAEKRLGPLYASLESNLSSPLNRATNQYDVEIAKISVESMKNKSDANARRRRDIIGATEKAVDNAMKTGDYIVTNTLNVGEYAVDNSTKLAKYITKKAIIPGAKGLIKLIRNWKNKGNTSNTNTSRPSTNTQNYNPNTTPNTQTQTPTQKNTPARSPHTGANSTPAYGANNTYNPTAQTNKAPSAPTPAPQDTRIEKMLNGVDTYATINRRENEAVKGGTAAALNAGESIGFDEYGIEVFTLDGNSKKIINENEIKERLVKFKDNPIEIDKNGKFLKNLVADYQQTKWDKLHSSN